MIIEAVGGWISGSLALLADAGHMLTDVGALTLSLLTAWIAQRPPDDSKTYGYLRWEILAALVNGAALFGIAALVVVEAIQRIQDPQPVRTDLFLAVASAGLVVNLGSFAVLHSAREGSLNVRGAYLHVLGDALGSVGAVAAAGIIALTGWTLADPIVSMAEVQRRMLGVPGVAAVHDLHVWTVTSGMVAMSGHAVVPDLEAHPGVLDGIRAEMSLLGIGHVTIQLEVEDGCEGCDDARESATAPRWGHQGQHHHHGHRH